MRFGLLGPVEVQVDGVRRPVGSSMQRQLLAALALRANRVVGASSLVDLLWGVRPPATAKAGLQGRISHLRRVLAPTGDNRLSFHAPGYVLQASPDELDMEQFIRLAEEGHRLLDRGAAERARRVLHEGLSLWRGPALHGVEGLGADAARLEERRLAALEDRIDADIRLGWHRELVAELEGLVAAEPLRERPHAQLMLALYRSGRQADALKVFHSYRERLVTELGIEPGKPLRQLHLSVLTDDAVLDLRAAIDLNRSGVAPPPTQLPPAVNDLIGRADEIAWLRTHLTGTGEQDSPVVCAVYGPAGSGKSAFAVHAAHEIRTAFPDGQLYVNLRGADLGREPSTRDVLAGFVRVLGASSTRLPNSVADRGSLYRDLLAGRRVLVVLDDAATERQVRSLLPNQPGCAALVTSRAPLTGLEGLRLLGVDVLSEQDAVRLLARFVGETRVSAEPEAARAIARRCGGLPLALRVAGARLAARPHWPLRILADRLADERRRLDELIAGDLDVRASIELSYRSLGEPERRVFRMIGAMGLTEFHSRPLAPLLDVPLIEVEQSLERLVDAQLIYYSHVDDDGRLWYRFHTLVRLFARDPGGSQHKCRCQPPSGR